MLLSLGICLALTSLSCVNCLTCLRCTDIVGPRHCKEVIECSLGEVCYVQQTTNRYGQVLYDLGCTEPSTCSNRSHGTDSCEECCSTELCNAAGCGQPGYPSGRGPICFSCSSQYSEGSCHIIDFCRSNEVCMSREEREFGDTVHISKCELLTHCQNLKGDVSIIGRSILDDTRSLTEITCHKCCHDDLCNANCRTKSLIKDCLDERNYTQVSGVYRIQPQGNNETINVYCDMTTDGGGWTVFQRRVNGSVDFYQNFSTYENGFGDIHGEFWLGLKYIQSMTSNNRSELRIELVAADGSTAYEVFQNFWLSAAPNYTLHVDQGTGTAGDFYGLYWHTGHEFSTYDHDNAGSCARTRHGGWWYNACTVANLNGQYLRPGTRADTDATTGITYYSFKSYESLKETKMMIRRA